MEFIGGMAVGMFIMCIIVAQLEKRIRNNNYFIEYNDVTDEYELIDHNKEKWENRVVFKATSKEAVEHRYKWILERREGTPKKLSKSKEYISKFRCIH